MKKIIIVLAVLAAAGLAFYGIRTWKNNKLYNDPNFASGNGRIEATEINIAAKLAGKIEKVNVKEGDKVTAGQTLAVMQMNVLEARLAQAQAKKQQAVTAEAGAQAQIAVKEAVLESAKANLEGVKVSLLNAEKRYKRSKELAEVQSKQEFDNDETLYLSKKAELVSAQAAIKEAEANLNSAKASAAGAKANILAADAEIASVMADIDDSTLRAPLNGRIQYRVAEPGEVLSAGGRVLNMVDLTDVYMTFFLPEEIAGKVKIGADARIILDAAPNYPIPAKVTYVDDVAQFTPKTVETREERQKLMFRIKAHIDRTLLEKYIDMVKTGLPGVVWVKLNDAAEWPKELRPSEEAVKKLRKMEEAMVNRNTAEGKAE